MTNSSCTVTVSLGPTGRGRGTTRAGSGWPAPGELGGGAGGGAGERHDEVRLGLAGPGVIEGGVGVGHGGGQGARDGDALEVEGGFLGQAVARIDPEDFECFGVEADLVVGHPVAGVDVEDEVV